jgi:hypothetical protein
MAENSQLNLKKQELLNQIDQIFASKHKDSDFSTQTDDELMFNHIWNSN